MLPLLKHIKYVHALSLAFGTHYSPGFVDGDGGFGAQDFLGGIINGDMVAGCKWHARDGWFAIYFNEASFEQFLSFTARADALLGQILLDHHGGQYTRPGRYGKLKKSPKNVLGCFCLLYVVPLVDEQGDVFVMKLGGYAKLGGADGYDDGYNYN